MLLCCYALKCHSFFEDGRKFRFVGGFSESVIYALDGLVDFGGAFKANHNCIEQIRLYRKAYGLFTVLGPYEIAVAYEFHTNDAVTVFAHNLELLHHGSYIGFVALGIPAFCGSVNVHTLWINANEIHIDPIQLCCKGCSWDTVAGDAVGTYELFLFGLFEGVQQPFAFLVPVFINYTVNKQTVDVIDVQFPAVTVNDLYSNGLSGTPIIFV